MKLLFITQKLHGQDAFGALWVRGLFDQGFEVTVLCLEARPELVAATLGIAEDPSFRIVSMGKERGIGKLGQVFHFWRHILTLKYDRVFIHMSPVWYALGWWYWLPKHIPTYLWYTHYKMQLGVKLFGWFGTRFFCATPQSLPQYAGSPKKTVTGHGIDMSFWPQRRNLCANPRRLLGVYRLSRSKRLELCLHALALLPAEFTWDIYGIEAEPNYVAEIKILTEKLGLHHRVTFHGTAAVKDLPAIYTRHRLILNMASETIDKTMLEAMTCGCFPVTTAANARAIGIADAPSADTPQAIAEFIKAHEEAAPISPEEMYRVVEHGHSLSSLVAKMGAYMRDGK